MLRYPLATPIARQCPSEFLRCSLIEAGRGGRTEKPAHEGNISFGRSTSRRIAIRYDCCAHTFYLK